MAFHKNSKLFKSSPFEQPTVAVTKMLNSITATVPSFKTKRFKTNGRYSNIINNFNLKKFGGKKDVDFDGIINKHDCNPFSVMRQDFSPFRDQSKAEQMSAARRFGGKNLKGLKKLGSGRDRTVYALDKDKVLKVAKNPGGLIQNTSESDIEYLNMGKHYETGKDYVVMKRNKPLSKQNKRKLANIRKAVSKHDRSRLSPAYSSYVRMDLSKEDSPLVKSGIGTDILDYSFQPQELFANRQWGEDKDGNLALNDGGALQEGGSLNKYRVKDFGPQDWQYKDWQDIKKQRQEYRNKGNYNPGASIQKQKQWRQMSTKQRNIERQNKPDIDGDRVPDEYDCEPNNVMAQDSDIFIGKSKNNSIFYTRPNKDSKKIYINNAKNLRADNDTDINMIANLINHEETHNLLYDEFGQKTSSALDSVTVLPVEDDNHNIINKDTAGLSTTHSNAKFRTVQALNQKIKPNTDILQKQDLQEQNKNKVNKHFNMIQQRSQSFYDKQSNIAEDTLKDSNNLLSKPDYNNLKSYMFNNEANDGSAYTFKVVDKRDGKVIMKATSKKDGSSYTYEINESEL